MLHLIKVIQLKYYIVLLINIYSVYNNNNNNILEKFQKQFLQNKSKDILFKIT